MIIMMMKTPPTRKILILTHFFKHLFTPLVAVLRNALSRSTTFLFLDFDASCITAAAAS